MSSSSLYFVALVAVVVLTAAQDCNHGHSDGCSIPADLPFFYKNAFRRACDKHDICYACGAGRNVPQHQCDLHLHRDAMAVCNGAKKRFVLGFFMDLATKTFCDQIAHTYFGAVEMFGSNHYETSPEGFCKQSWVPHCLA